MNLQELLIETKSKAIFLIDKNGKTIDSYPKKNDLGNLQEKITVFKATLFSMANHFFNTFLNADLNEIILKSNNENMFLIKYNEYILCFLSDKNINTSLLELLMKKEFNH